MMTPDNPNIDYKSCTENLKINIRNISYGSSIYLVTYG